MSQQLCIAAGAVALTSCTPLKLASHSLDRDSVTDVERVPPDVIDTDEQRRRVVADRKRRPDDVIADRKQLGGEVRSAEVGRLVCRWRQEEPRREVGGGGGRRRRTGVGEWREVSIDVDVGQRHAPVRRKRKQIDRAQVAQVRRRRRRQAVDQRAASTAALLGAVTQSADQVRDQVVGCRVDGVPEAVRDGRTDRRPLPAGPRRRPLGLGQPVLERLVDGQMQSKSTAGGRGVVV